MPVTRGARILFSLALVAGAATVAGGAATPDDASAFKVRAQEIDDLKSVYATVRTRDLIYARVRTPGTIESLKVDEGDWVKQGEVLAVVVDPKIPPRIKALDASIIAVQSRIETSKTELERSKTLSERGYASQARVDQAQTTYDVAVNELKSLKAQRNVIETESQEGEVLAPTSGRVLKVPVTVGSVVLGGESVATIAANEYLLRLELPERHARFIKTGDPIRIGKRGLGPEEGPLTEGRITQVYPELTNGRVVADAEVPDLGSYYVGERVLVWISAGKRETFIVPRDYIFKRFGLDYVQLKRDDGSVADVVVQTGQDVKGDSANEIEVLSGIHAGDTLVRP